MNVKKFGWLLLVALTLVLTACGKSQSQNGKLKVMTTFYPVYDFTKNIVGDEGTVDLLIGAGSEPHEYELSAKGRAMIQDSDVFVYENENMETGAGPCAGAGHGPVSCRLRREEGRHQDGRRR